MYTFKNRGQVKIDDGYGRERGKERKKERKLAQLGVEEPYTHSLTHPTTTRLEENANLKSNTKLIFFSLSLSLSLS